jgi:hypothetical protein
LLFFFLTALLRLNKYESGGAPPHSKTQATNLHRFTATFWSAALLRRFFQRDEQIFGLITIAHRRRRAARL